VDAARHETYRRPVIITAVAQPSGRQEVVGAFSAGGR